MNARFDALLRAIWIVAHVLTTPTKLKAEGVRE